MKNLKQMVDDIRNELDRSKMFINENGYHNGTALNGIVRRYRKELKELMNIIHEDDCVDNIVNYEK